MDINMPRIKGLSSDKWVSIFAFVISIGTLFTFIYQTRLMQEHQRASALPYLEIWCNISDDTFEVTIYNNGVGPAFIKESMLVYQDSTYQFQYGKLIHSINDSVTVSSSALTPGRVIPPKEKQLLLAAYNKAQIKEVRKIHGNINFKIRYASVFGEKWEINGQGIPPVKVE